MLFVNSKFVSHSGQKLPFKIECDALVDADIATLASIIGKNLGFGKVIGIPKGGLRLSNALKEWCDPEFNDCTLIVDDVYTTGASMEAMRKNVGGKSIGAVIFARTFTPHWVYPLFTLGSPYRP